MTRSETTNTFQEGLVMDLNPLTTPNSVLTSALNATLITFNGNEYVLQNDMGNGRVETAYLPEGYVPMGTAELGGIIYVVSYNPLINKCQIGSFPSPERNITSDEMTNLPDVIVSNSDFQGDQFDGQLKTFLLKVSLLDSSNLSNITQLNPGDKYAIYCTQGGITNNKEYISDIGNDDNHLQVDSTPRNVTIHVVSIGDDGKITYLDDSLKWTPCNNGEGNYYIKETQGSEIDISDVDQYRSLVNSAYNTFTSKVSGQLALLFELKVIDSFSLTWDSQVQNVEGSNYDRQAEILFEMNWTSSDSKINPKWGVLERSDYSESLAALNSNKVQASSYCEFNPSDRVNDGSDPNIIVSVGDFLYNSNETLQDYIWNYKVTPAMKFGKLPYLAKEGSINFLDIGSGKIEITEWRYFIQNTNFYMNCGFDIYPEKNKRIENITFYFIPFYKIERFKDQFAQSSDVNIYESSNDIPKYVITDRTSYAGNYQELINFGEFSRILNGTIEKDLLYLVNIVFKYGQDDSWEYRSHYRWLYTTGQWNETYTQGEVLDFNTLPLDDVLSYDQEWEVVDNIGRQTSTRNSGVTKPNEISEDPTYDMFGSMITTVNYNQPKGNQSEGSFDSNQQSYHVDTTTTITSYSNLFKFNQQDSDTYNFEIKQTSLQTDGDPVSYDMPSYLQDLVTPKIKEQNENDLIVLDEDLPSTIEGVALDGINSEEEDNKAIDQLEATLNPNNTSFDINVKGALFSKIAATLVASNVTVKQTLKPFVFEQTDFNRLGFDVSGNSVDTLEYFKESHQDLNKGGSGFTFYFTSNINGTDRTTTSKDDFGSEANIHLDYWWSGNRSFYTQLVNLMNRLKSCFKIVYTSGDGDNRTMFTSNFNEDYNGNNLYDYYYVWIKTENGNYLPINCFGKGTSGRQNLAKFLLVFYSQLYYVDTEQMETTLPVVSNIVYATNYREIYNILISSSINIAADSLNDHVSLYSENNGQLTLKQIQDLFSDDQKEFILINNISTSKGIEYEDKTLSHTFSLINESLYSTFLRGKETTIGGYAYLSSSLNVSQYSTSKDSRYIYVYNPEIQDFQKISSNSGNNIYSLSNNISIQDGRVIFSYNTGQTIGDLEILDYIQAKNGELVFSESSVLIDTYDIYFHTGAKGDGNAGLMAHGNSNLLINPNFKCPYNQ